MASISEQKIQPDTFASIQSCARDAVDLLDIGDKASDPQAVVEAIDAFVYEWQKGQRPPPDILDPEDAPFVLGSLWGEQLVKRFGWEWAMMVFHEHGDSSAPGVVSPDRSLAVYPIHFLIGCLQNPDVDATLALSYNLLDAGKIGKMDPGQYFNLMDGVHRIVPRD